MKRINAILGGGALKNPDTKPIDDYWNRVIESKPELAVDHQMRSIGIDEETTGLIIDFIKEGEKVGTFSLPWLMDSENIPDSHTAQPIMLLSYDGKPEIVVQITKIEKTTFVEVDYEVTKIDGPPVRDPEIWIPLHRDYWNNVLEPYGHACTDDMPIIVEHFKLVYSE